MKGVYLRRPLQPQQALIVESNLPSGYIAFSSCEIENNNVVSHGSSISTTQEEPGICCGERCDMQITFHSFPTRSEQSIPPFGGFTHSVSRLGLKVQTGPGLVIRKDRVQWFTGITMEACQSQGEETPREPSSRKPPVTSASLGHCIFSTAALQAASQRFHCGGFVVRGMQNYQMRCVVYKHASDKPTESQRKSEELHESLGPAVAFQHTLMQPAFWLLVASLLRQLSERVAPKAPSSSTLHLITPPRASTCATRRMIHNPGIDPSPSSVTAVMAAEPNYRRTKPGVRSAVVSSSNNASGPSSQIPGLCANAEVTPEERTKGRRVGIQATDSDYVKLAKQGGQKGLLWHSDPVEPKSDVSYKPSDWFSASPDER
ncbi:hypothetical protein DNTS_033777 [Danionella cerebrum]|uniref:Uncharacterized protein n=1 Tax=Danionella cerebrum TaxID=2873325 RepID=A0A553R315_9TELE|nr:hypothetical protein DNTS_033777 [Danionella translucida]